MRSTRTSRPTGLRLLYFVGSAALLGLIYATIFSIGYEADVSPVALQAITALIAFATYGYISPRVGYRWFDCLFLLVPLWSIVYGIKIWWRMTNLPAVDWPQRGSD